MQQISKDFPGVKALNRVDLAVAAGEVHGVVGANGAGKSTLVKILSGIYPDYKGSVSVEGRTERLSSPRIAQGCGIAVVQQEPDLAWNLSVSENIFLGKPKRTMSKLEVLDRKRMDRECTRLLVEYGAELLSGQIVGTLGRGEIQIVQIVKVLASRPKILVLDEPTTALTNEEREIFFRRLREFAEQGTSIVFISHDIEDVFQACQRISVLRDGSKIAEVATRDAEPSFVLQEMFGTTPSQDVSQVKKHGPAALTLNGVSTPNFKAISLTVHEGEVLGLAGKAGAGSEVLRAVYGAIPWKAGSVQIRGRKTSIASPQLAIRAGIGLVPEDRVRDGLFLDLSLTANITLVVLRKFARYGFLLWQRPRELAVQKMDQLKIRAPGADTKVAVLSGGNRQKTMFARWLCAGPEVFLLEEPTAGMDVGAKQEILRIVRDLGNRGAAVLMASSDVDELLHLCDRVVVLEQDGNTQLIEVGERARPQLIAALTGLKETQ
jgi:ribose transport system ATP-binding protein